MRSTLCEATALNSLNSSRLILKRNFNWKLSWKEIFFISHLADVINFNLRDLFFLLDITCPYLLSYLLNSNGLRGLRKCNKYREARGDKPRYTFWNQDNCALLIPSKWLCGFALARFYSAKADYKRNCLTSYHYVNLVQGFFVEPFWMAWKFNGKINFEFWRKLYNSFEWWDINYVTSI